MKQKELTKTLYRAGNIPEVLIFARRKNSRIQEFRANYFKIALLRKNKNSGILNFVKGSKIRNFEHAKITRSTVFRMI